MRGCWVLGALVVSACAGGQTGEITELGACREPIGAVSIDAPSEAGRSARAQLDAITTSATTELEWQDAGTNAFEVSFALSGEEATLLGGSECERPWLEVPVSLELRTSDGALDETMEGTAILAETGVATVQAALPLAELNGTLDVEGDDARASLRIDLSADGETLAGQLTLEPGVEGADGRALASF